LRLTIFVIGHTVRHTYDSLWRSTHAKRMFQVSVSQADKQTFGIDYHMYIFLGTARMQNLEVDLLAANPGSSSGGGGG